MNQINSSNSSPEWSPSKNTNFQKQSEVQLSIKILKKDKNFISPILLDSKEKILINKKIDVLNGKIIEIEKSLKASKLKTEKYVGGWVSKTPIIGAIIKLFLSWYNKRNLIKSKEEINKLNKIKNITTQKITILRQFFSAINSKKQKKIFSLENQLRLHLEMDFPDKKYYESLYKKHVLPQLQKIKQSIAQNPLQFAIQAAASKGKALQSSMKALKNLSENEPLIENSGVSAQEVFLLPKHGVVFKRSNEKAREEESIVNSLFDLMSKQSVLGTFKIQEASLKKFGIQSNEIAVRGYKVEDLDDKLRNCIKQKFSEKNKKLLENIQWSKPVTNLALENYQSLDSQQWFIRLESGDWKEISFKQLQKQFLADQLPLNADIASSDKNAVSLQKHLLENSPLFQALNYIPALDQASDSFYAIPDLEMEENRRSYEICEQSLWSYQDSSGFMNEVDFKTLHRRFLLGDQMEDIQPIPRGQDVTSKQGDLDIALNVGWKIAAPSIMEKTSSSVLPLRDVEGKPFVDDMILMSSLNQEGMSAILTKLTPESEYNACLTGELQLLDLHAGNLGIAPEPNVDYERFKRLPLFLEPFDMAIPLKELARYYLSGAIPPDTFIQYEENGKKIKKKLEEMPDLQRALDVRWNLVIFDTDLSLAEDNRLQQQIRGGNIEHLIPIRSVLLETEWKNKPLSQEVVQKMMDCGKREAQVKQWIKYEDAPIYKRLTNQSKEALQQQLTSIIDEYSLSGPRRMGDDMTLDGLRKEFANRLSTSRDTQNLEIWKIIEEGLSIFKNSKSDRVKLDLTSGTRAAERERRKIALQLFPRLTSRQQAALFERQQRRRDYLESYYKLLNTSLSGKDLLREIEHFLQRSETPLSSLRKEELGEKIRLKEVSLLISPLALDEFKKEICSECQPTYFNVMKAMYPLLADAYALNEAEYGGDGEKAGTDIGLYKAPLEEAIDYAFQYSKKGTPLYKLAENLQNQLISIPEPSFFGIWG